MQLFKVAVWVQTTRLAINLQIFILYQFTFYDILFASRKHLLLTIRNFKNRFRHINITDEMIYFLE